MKRNKFLRMASIILALVLITTIGMTGTLAKYIQPFDELGGTVARAGLFKILGPGELPISVSATNYDGAGVGNDADDVAAYDGTELALIVPGHMVKVEAEFDIVNLSEVRVAIGFDGLAVTTDGLDAAVFLCEDDGSGAPSENWLSVANFNQAVDDEDITYEDLFGLTTAVQLAPIDGTTYDSDTFTLTLWVLWPFSQDGRNHDDTGDSEDEYTGGQDDDADTDIGVAQADQLVVEVDVDEDTGTYDLDVTFTEDQESNIISFEFTANVVQVD